MLLQDILKEFVFECEIKSYQRGQLSLTEITMLYSLHIEREIV